MASNSIRNFVEEASNVVVVKPFKVAGDHEYTVGTNMLSIDGQKVYSLESIAPNFGVRRTNISPGVLGSSGSGVFACGESNISAFDFGLLYTVFNAMVMAKAESGVSVVTEQTDTTQPDLKCLWFGQTVIVYSLRRYCIIPIKSADIEDILKGSRRKCRSFSSGDSYTLDLEGNKLAIQTDSGELLAICDLSISAKNSLQLWSTEPLPTDSGISMVKPDSQLASLISSSDNHTIYTEILSKYRAMPMIEAIVSRDDLIIVPEEKYQDTTNFFGSICYTDKGLIVMAVNFRHGLFVCRPWFPAYTSDKCEVLLDDQVNFQKFYNVTAGCTRISRFANTVINRPLTAAEFDFKVVDALKEAFTQMQLPRIPLESAFGKVVIPERLLVDEVLEGDGSAAECFVPCGVVGDNIICICETDELVSVKPTRWDSTSAFYDITEVISNVKH